MARLRHAAKIDLKKIPLNPLILLVSPIGFEPMTYGLEGR